MNPLKRFFQEDIPATFSAGKWRIDLMQYQTRFGQLDKQKNSLLAELGKKAWDSKISNEKYSASYEKLEELERLVAKAQQEIDAVQNKINLETNHLNATNAEFDTRVKETQNKRQQALEKFTQLQTIQKDIERRMAQYQATANQYTANLQGLTSQENQILASDQVDKDAKIASIKSTAASIQVQKDDALLRINTAKTELETNQTEQMPVKREVEEYNQLIARLQQQNKEALLPIQEQLKLMRQGLLKANENRAKILHQMNVLMPEFGSQVYRYRPLSDALKVEYGKIDHIEKETKALADQINLTEARLASVNSGSLMKVAVTGGVLVFLVLSMVVLVTWGIPFVTKLLTPDPKSSIKLAQSWTIENCGSSGQADGTYYDISVWENRQANKVAYVEMETKLVGVNDIVLNSEYSEFEITPGGMVASMEALDSKGSRVQKVDRSITSVYFVETALKGQVRNLDVQMYFEKAQYSDNVSLALEISNKSDFSVSSSGNIYAFVINKKNQVIDILAGSLSDRTIRIDSMSKVTFQSVNIYSSTSCLQSDYTQEEVTFWYFVPLKIATDSNAQYMVSGKAVYKP